MRLIIFLFFLSACAHAFAQDDSCSRKVSGLIVDLNSGEPLPFATVQIQDSDNGAIANDKGEFIISNICEEEIDLIVRFVGYKTIIHHHDFHHTDPVIYMAPDATLLESVVIEESQQGELQSLSIKKKELDKISVVSSSIGDLTSELSGVSILKTGTNISKPMIHGLHSNRVLVINDGVRHAYQVWGQEHAPEIDPSHVDQIEIVKGAGTVKYGPEALGGVILYNSKRPSFNKELNGSVNASFRTNGKAPSSQISIGEGYQHFAWNIGGYGIYQGDLEAPDYNLSNTGKREYGGSFNALLHQDKFDVHVSGSYYDQSLGILRGSLVGNLTDLQNAIDRSVPNPTFPSTYDIQNPRQETTHGFFKSDVSLFLGDHIFNVQYAFQRNVRREFDVRRGELNERPVIDLKLLSHNFETEWIQPEKGRWNGSSGIQLYTQKSNNKPGSNPVNFVPDYDVFNVGVFTVQSLEFDNTTFEVGARFDFQRLSVADTVRDFFIYSNEVDYANATFTLGFKKQLNESISLFSNIGSAWRPPNVAELYSFGYHHSRIQFGLWRYELNPISTPPDAVLDETDRSVPSEKGIKWVSGIEVNKGRITSEFILFANRINDYIFLRPYGITTGIAGTFPFFIYDQTDAFFFGSDWDIRFNHLKHLSSEIKVSYVYAIETENRQALLEIPPLNISYTIDYKKDNWNYGLTVNYTATQWNEPPVIDPIDFQNGDAEINRNEIFDFMLPPDAYFLIDGQLGYEKKTWNAVFKISNLLNSSYRSYTDRQRYFADAPGRNFSLSFAYKF
ncbi:TonB-dependent receptor [Ekhidna sp. To15]|uniref:TonB-dependent receptor n=1 Tax=Ekhidna sp. To15 TaxID=3395267 RepID=UPI003F522B0F